MQSGSRTSQAPRRRARPPERHRPRRPLHGHRDVSSGQVASGVGIRRTRRGSAP
jgi:hypothetical protein